MASRIKPKADPLPPRATALPQSFERIAGYALNDRQLRAFVELDDCWVQIRVGRADSETVKVIRADLTAFLRAAGLRPPFKTLGEPGEIPAVIVQATRAYAAAHEWSRCSDPIVAGYHACRVAEFLGYVAAHLDGRHLFILRDMDNARRKWLAGKPNAATAKLNRVAVASWAKRILADHPELCGADHRRQLAKRIFDQWSGEYLAGRAVKVLSLSAIHAHLEKLLTV